MKRDRRPVRRRGQAGPGARLRRGRPDRRRHRQGRGRQDGDPRSIGFHSRITLADVEHEGIDGVTAADIGHGNALGYVIKLLGVAKLIDGRVNVRVYPALHPQATTRWPASAARTTPSSSRATPSTSHALRSRRRRPAHRFGGHRRHHLASSTRHPAASQQLHLLQGHRPLPRRRRRLDLLPAHRTSPTGPACWPRSRRSSARRGSASVGAADRGDDDAELVMVFHPVRRRPSAALSTGRSAVDHAQQADVIRARGRLWRVTGRAVSDRPGDRRWATGTDGT